MFGIGEFFKKIQNSYTKEILIRSIIKESILKHTGFDIPIEGISFKGSAVVLTGVNQSLRSTIYIKKRAILGDIAASTIQHQITDIR